MPDEKIVKSNGQRKHAGPQDKPVSKSDPCPDAATRRRVVGYSGTAESATTSCSLNRQIRVTRRTPSEYWLRRLFPGFGRTPRLYGKHET